MYGPALILHRLIDAQAVAPPCFGAEPIMLDFQAPEHTHAPLGQRMPFDPFVSHVRCHPLEMLFQERDDLLALLRSRPIYRPLLQGCQGVTCLLLVLAILEDAPYTTQERPQLPHVVLGLNALSSPLLLLLTHKRFRLEEQRAVLPQARGQRFQLL